MLKSSPMQAADDQHKMNPVVFWEYFSSHFALFRHFFTLLCLYIVVTDFVFLWVLFVYVAWYVFACV